MSQVRILPGHDSHGVVRIPGWVEGLEASAINAGCAPRIVRETAGSALMDGDRGLGPVVATAACACAAGKAKQAEIGMVSVRGASRCHTLSNRQTVCPKNLDPAAAITRIKRHAVKQRVRSLFASGAKG